jgi:uncharacterized protein YjbJ (UPF0337 family)
MTAKELSSKMKGSRQTSRLFIQKPKSQIFMATLEVKGDRNITKGKLKQKRGKLTHDGLQYVEGKSEELLGQIQKHTGEIREAVKESAAGRCE